ncbi:UDP-glycosyltransferase UGT5 [Drosophila tropicalis]|uniref:UDP-glycosyltransferase UGT5 n=1 Tax=Drosophila tropicalis TaxID=46794 RepID=UPI0035ABA2B4
MRLPFLFITLTIVMLSIDTVPTESAKILVTLPFPGRSQYIFIEAYLKALAAKGHQLTVINAFKNKPTPNIRFIEATKIQGHFDELLGNLAVASTFWEELNGLENILIDVMKCTLDDEGVQKLLHSGETFDLVISEMLQTEPLYAFAQHFNATLMGFSSYGNDHRIDEIMGNISPLSYNPSILSPRTDRMNFWERLSNHYEYIIESLHRSVVHLPRMRKMIAQYFPESKKTMEEILDSFTLMLLGQHFTLSYPRSYMPNMIEVGGLHIAHKPKPLPKDIKEFIETAADGVVYFSMGSNVKSKDLGEETIKTLLTVFSGLKQRVLWKFENDELPGKPNNVFISKWFPQPDILAHPNVKLFITHGGLLSSTESVYFGKPLLGLPVFFDQHMNVQRASRMGFGLGLDLHNLNAKDLSESIHTLLTTPSYTRNAALIAERYRDQPEPALDRAIWWTEYIIRQKGAPHMRAASRDMNFIQHRSLDTLAVLLSVPLVLLLISSYIITRVIRYVIGGKSKMSANQQKKTKQH